MFSDERNGVIYNKAIEMQKAGYETITPYHIVVHDNRMMQYASYMCELASDWYFLHKKVMYNERQWLWAITHNYKPKYTEVMFTDYVNRFIQLVFSS